MASIEWNIAEGISYRDDPATGVSYYTITGFARDLSEGSAAQLIAQALSMCPPVGSPGPIGNTVVYSRDPEPFPPVDCIVKVNYGPPIAGSLFGPPKLRIGSTAEQQETEFDADNLAKPLLQRTPIVVRYDPSADGAPATTGNRRPVRSRRLRPVLQQQVDRGLYHDADH